MFSPLADMLFSAVFFHSPVIWNVADVSESSL